MTSATPDNFVELRSALPIRQAILRRLQLEKEYDKMKPDMKQAFDLAHIHDLDPSDQVVVRIVNDCADVPGYGCGDWIPRPTQAALRLPDGTLMQAIQITGKTEVLANVYDYVFPRNVGGKPLYSPSDSFIAVDIGFYLAFDMKTHEVIPREFHESGREYKFKIADMVYKGKLEY
ncbi:MAG TPA: hypothetical protein VLV89_12915 [Candidatus Acidoferrum sp.]|nr:hypothetical protein [Candidatus Acidoferrum sp.]